MQLDPSAVAAGVRLVALPTIDSTNKEALRRARQGERGPLWIASAEQTAGRGRMDRSWESPAGNLHASLLLHDPAPFAARAGAYFRHGAGACATPSLPRRPRWRKNSRSNGRTISCSTGKKCAGILIEGEADPGKSLIVVIGIGVNCARHPAGAAYPATDLRAHGAATTPEQLFPRLSAAMVRRMTQWDRGGGFASIVAEWLKAASGIGEPIRVRNGVAERTGRFVGLDQSGRLLLERAGGIEKISAGDVFPIALRGSGPVWTQTG